MPGNAYYYADKNDKIIDCSKVKSRRKFEPKLLLWIAISDKGMSEPFIASSGLAITKEVYTKHCLEQRLLPFLSNKHTHDDVLFWPDKASAHYA